MRDDFSRVTFVFSMPRSRSQWLCWLFKNSGIRAWHDPLAMCASPAELVRKIRSDLHAYSGPLLVVDTGAIFFHNQLRQMMPNAKYGYLIRNDLDCAESIYRHTGRNVRPRMAKQMERMMRYAFSDKAFRMFFGLIDSRIGDLWQIVDNKPMPASVLKNYEKLRGTIIDVPPGRQVIDHFKVSQLRKFEERE